MSEAPANITRFHVSISGYEGSPTTLICALKTDSNILVVAKEEALRETRREGYGLVTNLHLPASDWLFTDDHIRQAINTYMLRSTQGTLDILEALGRHEPRNSIIKDGFDENGPRYRIAADITNGQLAVLAACGFADKQASFAAALGLADDFLALYSIYSI
ncbi:hypothetical protein BJP27_24035 (plasmid) [Pseudomonas oryzihabitans]|nr:hypothetical protein BJP27_24035 [Pseudomonas psychrotolerans]